MNRWLLNTFSTWELVVIILGVFMGFAAAGFVAVRRRFPHFAEGEHNDVTGILLGVVGAIYGIVLAFVIVAVYEDFKAAESNVRGEATDLSQVYRDTRNLDAIAAPLAAKVRAYDHHVVVEEWPLMAHGRLLDGAWADIEGMYALMRSYEPKTQAQSAFYGEALGKLNDLVSDRRERLSNAQEQLPTTFEILLFGGALLLIVFTWFIGMRNFRAQLFMVLAVAALVSFNLLIALALDHPFSGDVTVSSQPFREGALAHFWP